MYNKGDIVKFEKSDDLFLNAVYDYDKGKKLCAKLGLRVNQYCTLKENKGIVVHHTGKSTHTLVEYVNDKGDAGVLYFENGGLILLEKAQRSIVNNYEIY